MSCVDRRTDVLPIHVYPLTCRVVCDLALARLQAAALQHLAAHSLHDEQLASEIPDARSSNAAVAIGSAADHGDVLQQRLHAQAAVQQVTLHLHRIVASGLSPEVPSALLK